MISSKRASDNIDNPIDGGNIKYQTGREQTYIYIIYIYIYIVEEKEGR